MSKKNRRWWKRHQEGQRREQQGVRVDLGNNVKDKEQPKREPPPPLTAAMLRQIAGFEIAYEDSDLWSTERAIKYVFASNGTFEVRQNRIGRSVRRIDQVPALVALAEGYQLAVPKIPWAAITQTVAFFREVSRKHGSCEAFIQYWFDPRDGRYKLWVPEQRVSGASVNVNSSEESLPAEHEAMIHVADCHSHGSGMSGFFSGTDDRDELAKGDRLYIVIGKVLDIVPDIRLRAVAGKAFLPVDPNQALELPTATPISFVANTEHKGSTGLNYAVDIFRDATFPAEWMERLKTREHAQYSGPRSMAEYMHGLGYSEERWNTAYNQETRRDQPPLLPEFAGLEKRAVKHRRNGNGPPFLNIPYEDFEDASSGKIYRVYSNGYCEDITEEVSDGIIIPSGNTATGTTSS